MPDATMSDTKQAETPVIEISSAPVFMTRDPDKGGLGITSANVPADEVPNWESAGWVKAHV